MDDQVADPNEGAWKMWCCAPVIGIAVLALIGGAYGYFSDDSKDEARAACERVAVLRGEESTFTDVQVKHLSGDAYTVDGIVRTPGLEVENFHGIADRDSHGRYGCQMQH